MKRTTQKLFKPKLATLALAFTAIPIFATPQAAFDQPMALQMVRRKPVQASTQTSETGAMLAAGCALVAVGLVGRKRRIGRL